MAAALPHGPARRLDVVVSCSDAAASLYTLSTQQRAQLTRCVRSVRMTQRCHKLPIRPADLRSAATLVSYNVTKTTRTAARCQPACLRRALTARPSWLHLLDTLAIDLTQQPQQPPPQQCAADVCASMCVHANYAFIFATRTSPRPQL